MLAQPARKHMMPSQSRTHYDRIPPTTRGGRLSPLPAEAERAWKRLNMDRDSAEKARTRYATLGEILDSKYTAELPSSTSTVADATKSVDDSTTVPAPTQHAVFEIEGPADDASPVLQEASRHLNPTLEDGVASQTDILDSSESLTIGRSQGVKRMLIDLYGDSISVLLENPTAPGSESIESNGSETIHKHDEPRQATHGNDDFTDSSEGRSQKRTANIKGSHGAAACESSTDTPTSSAILEKGKRKSSRSSSDNGQHEVLPGPYAEWIQEPAPGGHGHFIMRRPPRVYHPDADSHLEEPLDAPPERPAEAHLAAAERLAPDERLHLLREFLQHNAVRFETFYARKQPYQATDGLGRDRRAIETIFSSTWDDKYELKLLTDAILWIDALLSSFRAEIIYEDLSKIKPRLHEISRHLQTIRVPRRQTTAPELNDEDKATYAHYYQQILDVQASNVYRRRLLDQTNIDIATFDNLLQSAEIIKHRSDLGRDYGQKDDLVDGLHRIFSTIVCTIPVDLSETDRVDEPPRTRAEQYGCGPFNPYRLPGCPELFDHDSITTTRISSQGYTGIQLSEKQNPLSKDYWRNMHAGMVQVVAAQKQDEIGQAKLRKDPNSMDRDLDAFYAQVYGQEMANYFNAAAQRIEEEEREELKKRTSTEEGQTKNRAASGEVTTPALEPKRIPKQRRINDKGDDLEITRNSPRLSDCSDLSNTSIQLELGNQTLQKPARNGRFCLFVNKPGGCPDYSRCGYDSHDNEGRPCQLGLGCTYGERCAFVHATHSNEVPRASGTARTKSATGHVSPLTRDLKPILADVLADPKRYKVCTYINTSVGCKSEREGVPCKFNHTLKGLACEKYQHGNCPLGDRMCPLWHVAQNKTTYNRPQRYEENPSAWTETQGLGIKFYKEQPHIPLSRLVTASNSNAPAIFHDQALTHRDLPAYTPTGSRVQTTRFDKSQAPNDVYIQHDADGHSNRALENKRKRDDYQHQFRRSGESFEQHELDPDDEMEDDEGFGHGENYAPESTHQIRHQEKKVKRSERRGRQKRSYGGGR